MRYTMIGTGNMAFFLAERLSGAGFECKGVFGRDREEAEKLSRIAGTDPIESLRNIPDIYDCCIMAVSDNAIGDVAGQLNLKETVLVHTAGSVSLDVIPHANRAVLWPIYSIVKNDLPKHRELPVVFESDSEKGRETVLGLAQAISDQVREVQWQERQWMHLIAAFGNNFINHIMAICERLCAERQVPFDLFKPILQQTFERLYTTTPYDAQTGAAKRHDESTMLKHMQLLQEHPDWQRVYEELSTSIKDMYRKEGK